MTEDEPTSTEIVVSRLDDLATPEADKLCQVAIEGDRVADRLDKAEDWLHPLKLTGGTVCLAADLPGDGHESYYQVRSDTLHHYFREDGWDTGLTETGPAAVSHLEGDVTNSERSVRPVPVEETPFVDPEGGDPTHA